MSERTPVFGALGQDFRFELYNGKKHGLYEEFFENGVLRYSCRFQHGKQDLCDERFDKHGCKLSSKALINYPKNTKKVTPRAQVVDFYTNGGGTGRLDGI